MNKLEILEAETGNAANIYELAVRYSIELERRPSTPKLLTHLTHQTNSIALANLFLKLLADPTNIFVGL